MGKTSKQKNRPVRDVQQVERRVYAGLSRCQYAVMCLMTVATLAVYWHVFGFGFIYMDDYSYVTGCEQVKQGLSPSTVLWSLTATASCNWHPLTWLSLMLDYQLGGLNPGLFHSTNVILHIINTLLLIVVLSRMTGSFWRSAFVAALFALHPAHVESVAWISERKDVLSTMFWLLAMLAYYRYSQKTSTAAYMLVAAAFVLGLMSKPMLVTLPLVLLLMDFWPLQRWTQHPSSNTYHLIKEKFPLFALVVVSCVVTVYAQRQAGAVGSLESFPVGVRLANAVVAYSAYLVKMVWPHDLAFFYPHPGYDLPAWQVSGSLTSLIVMTVLAVRTAKTRPYILFGWLWYLITLVPVIGLVQVGAQALADRYTYVPYIGAFVIAAWGVPDLLSRFADGRKQAVALGAAGVIVLAAFAASTMNYLPHWKNDFTIWTRANAVVRENWMAHYNLGVLYGKRNQTQKALYHYSEALRIMPDDPDANNNYANMLVDSGEYDEAIYRYEKVLAVRPDDGVALNNMGRALEKKGNIEEAIAYYRKSLQIDPGYSAAHINIGAALNSIGKTEEADEHYKRALRDNPNDPDALNNVGLKYAEQGDYDQAVATYRKALEVSQDYPLVHFNLANALLAQDKTDEAAAEYEEAIEADPDYEAAYFELGRLLAGQGKADAAVGHFKEVIRINPRHAVAHSNVGVMLAQSGKLDDALVHFSKAVDIDPKNLDAQCNLAFALSQRGRIDGSIQHYREALRINPNHEPAKLGLERVMKSQF